MKWMIASDLHGSYFYASQMQQAFEREQADRLLLLGDLLYHGPRNDLPEGYAPKQVMPLLNGMKDRLLCVRGNCDAEVDQMVLEFPVLADYAVLPVGRRLVYATHGHVYNTKTPPPLAPGDILLHKSLLLHILFVNDFPCICLSFYLIATLIQNQVAALSFCCQKAIELYQ